LYVASEGRVADAAIPTRVLQAGSPRRD